MRKRTLKFRVFCGGILWIMASCSAGNPEITFHPLALPEELASSVSKVLPSAGNAETISFSAAKFEKNTAGLLATLEKTEELIQDQMPVMAYQTRQYEISGEGTAELAGVELFETDLSLSLFTAKPAYSWRDGRRVNLGNGFSNRYFPGKLIQSRQVGSRLQVTLFPLQWDRIKKTVVVLRSATLILPAGAVRVYGEVPVEAPRSVIVTSQSLKSGAEALSKFYQVKLGVRTEIIYVESLVQKESPLALTEYPSGIKTPEGFETIVKLDESPEKGYSFERARRVASFFRRLMKEKVPPVVTVLGDATLVPPSYYFRVDAENGKLFGVTDQCYLADNGCLVPRLAMGRLPFASEQEVVKYLEKSRVWLNQQNRLQSELALYGGKAFAYTDIYVGELGGLGLLEAPGADWVGVEKVFRTDGRFKKSTVMEALRGQGRSPLIYYLDHGTGNRWFVDNEMIGSQEILNLTPGEDTVSPLVMAVSCSNAAYDTQYNLEDIFASKKDFGSEAVGTALLKSPAGAVAYLGMSRDSLGSPEYKVDKRGNIELIGSTYGLQMLEGFVEKHRLAPGKRMGEVFRDALFSYSQEKGNDMAYSGHALSYFITTFLGDPMLPMPQRIGVEKNLPIAESSFDGFDNTLGFGFPRWVGKPGESLRLPFVNPTRSVAKMFRIERNIFGVFQGEKKVLEQDWTGNGLSELVASDLSSGDYFVRVINLEGMPRERQVYFTIEKAMSETPTPVP